MDGNFGRSYNKEQSRHKPSDVSYRILWLNVCTVVSVRVVGRPPSSAGVPGTFKKSMILSADRLQRGGGGGGGRGVGGGGGVRDMGCTCKKRVK